MVGVLVIITIFCLATTATALWMVRRISKNYKQDLAASNDEGYFRGFEEGMRSILP